MRDDEFEVARKAAPGRRSGERRDHVGGGLDELDEHALAALGRFGLALGVNEADVEAAGALADAARA